MCSSDLVMMKLYRESAVFSEDIQNFYILGNDGVCFNEKRGIYQIERHEKSQYIYDMILNHENELLVLSSREMGWEEEDCFVIGQKIRQTWTNKTIGIIAIEMKAHAVQSVYMDEVLGETGYFSLYDKDGREMFSEEGSRETEGINLREEVFVNEAGSYQEKAGGNTELIVYDSIANTGWRIVGHVPLRELMAPVYKLGVLFLVAILLTLVFLGALYYYLSRRITDPITELKEKMLLAEQGDMDATVMVTSKDEISILQRQYNRMLSHIKVLMEENIEEQRNLQKAELKALQAQINPHFLYNKIGRAHV